MGDKVSTTLLCPNQLRAYGLLGDDVPMHLAPKSRPSSHSIICQEENFTIPSFLNGVFSYFPSRTPTVKELETCKRIHLMDEQDWNPHSNEFQNQENNIMEHNWGDNYVTSEQRRIMAIHTSDMHHLSSALMIA
jgi:hypothetical protein